MVTSRVAHGWSVGPSTTVHPARCPLAQGIDVDADLHRHATRARPVHESHPRAAGPLCDHLADVRRIAHVPPVPEAEAVGPQRHRAGDIATCSTGTTLSVAAGTSHPASRRD